MSWNAMNGHHQLLSSWAQTQQPDMSPRNLANFTAGENVAQGSSEHLATFSTPYTGRRVASDCMIEDTASPFSSVSPTTRLAPDTSRGANVATEDIASWDTTASRVDRPAPKTSRSNVFDLTTGSSVAGSRSKSPVHRSTPTTSTARAASRLLSTTTISRSYEDKITSLEADHQLAVDSLKADHDTEIARLKAEHTHTVQKMKAAHDAKVKELTARYQSTIEAMDTAPPPEKGPTNPLVKIRRLEREIEEQKIATRAKDVELCILRETAKKASAQATAGSSTQEPTPPPVNQDSDDNPSPKKRRRLKLEHPIQPPPNSIVSIEDSEWQYKLQQFYSDAQDSAAKTAVSITHAGNIQDVTRGLGEPRRPGPCKRCVNKTEVLGLPHQHECRQYSKEGAKKVGVPWTNHCGWCRRISKPCHD